MMCFSPLSIQNPNSNDVKDRLTVPCGRCYACRMNKRIEWTFRLSKELAVASSAYFVTLTYSDLYVPRKVDESTGEVDVKVLRKVDLQQFIKSLRYYSKFRYFAVGEYGERTFRPHYHILIFNISRSGAEKIGQVWKYGEVHIGRVEAASIHYVTKDMMKEVELKTVAGVEAFRVMSTKPAIGSCFMDNAMNNKLAKDFTVFLNGFKISMPRYYRERVFNIREKEEHQQEMIKEADRQFMSYMDECKIKGITNPFKYLEENREGLLRREKKLLKMRKL